MKKITLALLIIPSVISTKAQDLASGRRQLYYERYSSAARTFETILQKDPSNVTAIYELSKTLVLQNRTDEAGRLLVGAPKDVQQQPLYKTAYAGWLLATGKKDSAMMYFNEALDNTKHKSVDVLSAVAEANITSPIGDPAFAMSCLNEAIRREKKNSSLYVLLGDVFMKQANGAAAYENYNKATQLDEKNAAAFHKLGLIFLSQKNSEIYLDYFNKAVNTDPGFAPSLYQLYAHYFFYDPVKASEYYEKYVAVSDPSIQREYDKSDILFLNKKYMNTIEQANKIIAILGKDTRPRLFKLVAYSQVALNDTVKALENMQTYFSREADSNLIAKDYELMANLYKANIDSSTAYLLKAMSIEKDTTTWPHYYKKLADLAKTSKDYSKQATWLGKYYSHSKQTTNVDLFSWGLAHYLAGEYNMADSVFGIYSIRYPDQSFGYYWRARTNAALDKEMKDGLAVPYYQKLTEILATNPSDVNFKKWMTEAYGYLAAFKANTQNNYTEAIGYFEKVLEIDPSNESAKKYIEVLEKDQAKAN